MRNAQRFTFTEGFDAFGIPDALPQMPLNLMYQSSEIEVLALLDTGASVNVLPYSVGLQLGAVWEEQTTTVTLAGNFDLVRLIFAWSQSDEAPLLLGRMNFFMEFDVCFYRSQLIFEVSPKSQNGL